MCGIAGYIGTRFLDDSRLEACQASMTRRGPDARGALRQSWSDGRHAVLLHSRLAIIDLDRRADQPLRLDGQALCYNGELYNYVEVRRALLAEGAPPFLTNSDTEVLARQLSRHGWSGLDACEGMWAFALLDETDGSLLLARDRFGEKPLYLMRTADGLYFGSEVKFIAALAGRWPEPDLDHLKRYLVNGYKALYKRAGTGFFKGVSELPAGCVLSIDKAGRETLSRYWTPTRDPVEDGLGFEESVTMVREALVRSVELRLRADVPLAFCLSGGVDSNALIAIAKRLFGYDVHGFTLMNTDERYEEAAMVKEAVSALGLRHTVVPIHSDGFLTGLRTLVRQHDAPVYTITYYVQWLLMGAIAGDGYRVSVSGTGADELFSGYFDHHNAYLAAVHDDPDRHAAALADWSAHVWPIVRNPYLQDPALFVRDPGERRHIYLDAEEFAGFLTQPWHEPFEETDYSAVLLRNRMQNELFHESVPPILHEDDLNAMHWSIENRSPFLDRKLFETAQRVPSRHLVRNGRAKALLREAVRGIAPDAIIDNPRKVGFNAPIQDLLDTTDPEVRHWLFDDGPIFEHVRKDHIRSLLERGALPNSRSKFLFYFLNAKLFLEEFGG
ncbi:asparagine synthase (glutamine-hydrolyzing) [Azospirillum aestuarii]|uniref:asparagine synthase (glutamine-hydrolyzing) n=1 Tax=Azospirillum aestuarii TaxID=2802052 RepID=UPI004054CC5B